MTNARQMCCGSDTVTRATSSSSSLAGLFLVLSADTANNSHLLLYTRRRYGFTALPPSFHTYPYKNVIDIAIFWALLIVKVWLVRENYILFAANIRKNEWMVVLKVVWVNCGQSELRGDNKFETENKF